MNLKQSLKSNKATYAIGHSVNLIISKALGEIDYIGMSHGIRNAIRNSNASDDGVTRYYILSGTHMAKRGLFGNISVWFRYLDFAYRHGYIPVIDMMTVPNCILKDNQVGKTNGWELLFEQPSGVSISDIGNEALKRHGGVIIVDTHGNGSLENRETSTLSWKEIDWGDASAVERWAKVHSRIRIREDIYQQINNVYENLLKDHGKILGVKVRGTDYVACKPVGHPKQPEVSDVIEDVEKFLKEHSYDCIFLSTEDKQVKERFIKKFGCKCVFNETEYYMVKSGEYLYEMFAENFIDPFQNNLDYLTNIVLLTKCNSVILSESSATSSILLWNWRYETHFEHVKRYEMGHY